MVSASLWWVGEEKGGRRRREEEEEEGKGRCEVEPGRGEYVTSMQCQPRVTSKRTLQPEFPAYGQLYTSTAASYLRKHLNDHNKYSCCTAQGQVYPGQSLVWGCIVSYCYLNYMGNANHGCKKIGSTPSSGFEYKKITAGPIFT